MIESFLYGVYIYYDEVIACIRETESILILGPGEAKGELKKRLEKENLGNRIVGLKTSDKMTDKQIVAVVRGHFNQKEYSNEFGIVPRKSLRAAK